MIRNRRQAPWIHRWSRPIIIAIATLGAIGTAYLTYEKLFGGEVACPTSGCQQVLASPYANVFGLPLTVFGFLGYFGMGLFAAAPLVLDAEKQRELRNQIEEITGLFLFLGGTAMMVFSGYLMYLLVDKIHAVCIYCVTSAVLSTSLFVLSLVGRQWEDSGQLFFSGIIMTMITVVASLGIYAQANPQVQANDPRLGPPITTISSPAAVDLAKHLTSIGAKMYGAYWCPHCHEQKEVFGKEATKLLNYVECDPNGLNPHPDECKAQNVTGYPTWAIQGKTYSGFQSLEELAKSSNYKGDQRF
jgi:uncharacterized membrane protein